MITHRPAVVVVQCDEPNASLGAARVPQLEALPDSSPDRRGYRHEAGEDRIDLVVFAQEYHRMGGGAWACQRPPGDGGVEEAEFAALLDLDVALVLGELGPGSHGWIDSVLARRPRVNGSHPIKACVPGMGDLPMARTLMLAGHVELLFLSAPLALEFSRRDSLRAAADWLAALPGTSIITGETGLVRAGDETVEHLTWLQLPRGVMPDDRSGSPRTGKRRTLHTAFAATVIAACSAMQAPLREALVLGRANRAAIEAADGTTHGHSASQVRLLHRDLPTWPAFLLELEVSARRR